MDQNNKTDLQTKILVLYRLVSLNENYDHIEINNIEGSVLFGRSKRCDIIFKNERISGIHMNLTFEDGNVYVNDRSKNGTFINDKIIGNKRKVILYHQDKISLAPNKIEYLFLDIKSQTKTKLKTPIDEKYCLHQELGRGSTGIVYYAKHIETEKEYAIKIVDKRKFMLPNSEHLYSNKRNLIEKLNHPNIIKCYETFENDTYIYYILEYAKKGDFIYTIIEKDK